MHYGKPIDVGRCNGDCKENSCKALEYSCVRLESNDNLDLEKKIKVI